MSSASRQLLIAEKIALMNKQRLLLLEKKRQSILEEAQREFSTHLQNPLFVLGLGIYWGEGDKTKNGRVSVINSDPLLLQTVIAFYRQVLLVKEKDIRAGLFLYADHDISSLKEYWSKVLSLDQSQFIKTQILPTRSSRTKRRAKFGMCSVYFSSTALRIKIQAWTHLLSQYLRK